MSDDRGSQPAGQVESATAAEGPATFRNLFAVSEYRAVYLDLVFSWVGDYLARAAITVLVYQRTGSVLLSAATFAMSYLPGLLGGPVLSALAERYPYRRVMVVCGLTRTALILLVLIPGLPVAALLGVLFLVTLGSIPAQAARSAMLPLLLSRGQFAVAMAANTTTTQAAQVAGYLTGATLAASANPHLVVGLNALAFAVGAVVILIGVRHRPAAFTNAERTHLLRETGQGFRLVFSSPVLRPIALLVFSMAAFAIVPEGLAAAWAAQENADSATRGLDQGVIMASGPVGFVIGGLAFSRLVGPRQRHRMVRPLAVLAPLVLVPALAAPPVPVVALLTTASGVVMGCLMPTLNTQFVLALPHGYRARAFGVMQQGLQLSQGGAVLATGTLADRSSVPLVVGVWSLAGVGLMLLLALRWPAANLVDGAIENAAQTPPPPAGRGNARHTRPQVSGAAGRMDV